MNKLHMKKSWKKLAALAITTVTLASSLLNPALAANAAEAQTQASTEVAWPQAPDISSTSAILMDVDSGKILYDKDSQAVNYPASITKIMTALLVLENCKLDETVTFSADAVFKNENGTSSIARDLDEQMTVEQTLYGMMLESANECAWALAEHVTGGDVNKFVEMMNEKAASLGCQNTHFANPNGLHRDDHYTSAYDMALIARAAYENETFRTIVGTRQTQIPPTNKHEEITPLNNHHQMLNHYKTSKYLYDGCLGGKTGFTPEARYTLVTYAQRNGMTVLSVVMHVESCDLEYSDTASVLDYGFNNFTASSTETDKTGFQDIAEKQLNQLNNKGEGVELGQGHVVLPNGVSLSDCKANLNKMSDDSVKEDGKTVVATVDLSYGDHSVGSMNLVYTGDGSYDFTPAEDKQSANKSSDTKKGKTKLAEISGFVVLLIIVFFATRLMRSRNRRRRRRR